MPSKLKIYCCKCGSELREIFGGFLYRCDTDGYIIAMCAEEEKPAEPAATTT